MVIKAYAAMQAGEKFQPYEYNPGNLGLHDVEIKIKGCGICHSDISMWKNHWDITSFPFVGGHEVSGLVSAIGELVTNVNVGDKVGLGWHKGYCNVCQQCLEGDHNLCSKQEGSIVNNYGGFADKVRAQDTSVIKIPEALDINDVGPLLCGGITVFNPFIQFNIKPTSHIGVIGIGGLGHLALQFANAWGCEVTAFTSTAKMDEAKKMGAHHCFDSRNSAAIAAAARRFDLVLSTINVDIDWNAVVATLKPKGRLHFLGAVKAPLNITAPSIISSQNAISGSPVGSPATLKTMMEFTTRHRIKPVTEHFKLSEINEAFKHLESGKARYRIVLNPD